MKWLDSTLSPFRTPHWQDQLVGPGLLLLAGLFYAVLSGAGFLFIVGTKTYSVMLALAPTALVVLVGVTMAGGVLWEGLAAMQQNEDHPLPDSARWGQYLGEGAQLLLFYGLSLAFLTSATMLTYPFGLIIPLLVLAGHPLLAVPVLSATENRNFLGLLDGCLEIPQMLRNNYPRLWTESTLYGLIGGGLLYPVLIVLSSLTGVGLLLLPGWLWFFASGYLHLLCRLEDAPLLTHHKAPARLNMRFQPMPPGAQRFTAPVASAPRNPFKLSEIP